MAKRLSGGSRRGLALALSVVVGSAAGLPRSWAQTTPPDQATPVKDAPKAELPELDVYEGRLVRRVVLQRPVKPRVGEDGKVEGDGEKKFEPLTGELFDLASNAVRTKAGLPFRRSGVVEDVSRLNRLGRFSPIDSGVQLLADGTVSLVFTLNPVPFVRAVQSVGNRRLTDQEIAKEVEVLKNTPVDRYQLDRAARRIEAMYREKGYYLAQVTVDERELEEQGIVIFDVREGDKLKVADIRFEGNRSFSPGELSRVIKTREAWLLERGLVNDDLIDTDVVAIANFYKDRGYLDVRTGRTFRTDPGGREAIVTFFVEEGPIYTLRDVRVQYEDPSLSARYETEAEAKKNAKPGQQVVSTPGGYLAYSYGEMWPEQVRGLMTVKRGDVYSEDKLRSSVQEIRDAFGQMGYVDAQVVRQELRDPEKPVVDVLIRVFQGGRFRTGEILTQDNYLTRDKVVRRLIDLKPDRPLDTTRLGESRKRLQDSNLFAPPGIVTRGPTLTVQNPDPIEFRFRDVLVQVEETNTGRFNIGAAVSSDGGITGIVSLEQRNFDLFDPPDTLGEWASGRAFRGGGQTFRLTLAPGDRTQNYSIGLSDPAILDTDMTGGATLRYYQREYDDYNEERYGGTFNIGRRFGQRWRVNVPIVAENVNIFDLEADAPTDYEKFSGNAGLTSVGLALTRTSSDSPTRPSNGSKLFLGVDQIGAMGGDYDFTKLQAEYTLYLPLYRQFLGPATVLSLSAKMGYIPQDSGGVPFYERFYSGGQEFRGFGYRAVAPLGIRRDNGEISDETVGGNWKFLLGAEINQPILEDVVSLVGFVDTGTVQDSVGFDEYRVSVGMGVRLYVPALSSVPLAFDFGFPILKQDGDRTRLFTFSVDIPFN